MTSSLPRVIFKTLPHHHCWCHLYCHVSTVDVICTWWHHHCHMSSPRHRHIITADIIRIAMSSSFLLFWRKLHIMIIFSYEVHFSIRSHRWKALVELFKKVYFFAEIRGLRIFLTFLRSNCINPSILVFERSTGSKRVSGHKQRGDTDSISIKEDSTIIQTHPATLNLSKKEKN